MTPVPPPDRASALPATTLFDLLEARSDDELHGYVAVDGDDVRRLTYAEVWRGSHDVAETLRSAPALASGSSRVAVLVPTDDPLAFVTAFFGALLAGACPVPVPDPLTGHPRNRRRVESILAACPGAVVAVTPARTGPMRELVQEVGIPAEVCTVEPRTGPRPTTPTAGTPGPLPVEGEYWQYTSGTVGRPKRIAVDVEQAVRHLRQAADVYQESQESVSVNWVPLHHDMGLVTSVLRPLHGGYDSVVLRPDRFVARPAVWPVALTRFRATHTSAPDFGYALCARKAALTDDLDLSRLRVARVAGELVRARTMERFAEVFGPAGFRFDAFAPSYGMAEATLTVTTCAVGDPPAALWVDRAALARDTVEVTDAERPGSVSVVSCGAPLPGTTVTVLTPDGTDAAPELAVGEVHVAGPQVVLGEESVTVAGVVGRRTGDLGFLHRGELYLVGRSHERFQVNGENYYMNDLEDIAQRADPRVRAGRVMVAPDDDGDPVRAPRGVVVAAELRGDDVPSPESFELIGRRIVGAVSREGGLTVTSVRLVESGTLPLTSSGKLKRGHATTLTGLPGLWHSTRKDDRS
ncbi:AMP-binding protein [Cellulomonas sp. URHB0016]